MKILYITPSFQHPTMRGPTRCYHFIKQLSPRHDITMLSLQPDEIKPEAMAEMQKHTREIFTFSTNGASGVKGGVAGKLPVIGKRVTQQLQHSNGVREMKKKFQSLARSGSFDLVVFHGKHVFPVIADFDRLPIVVDFCDATSMRIKSKMNYVSKKKRALLKANYLRIRQIEKKLVSKTPHVAFISPRDRSAIMGEHDRSLTIPIGVDLQFWSRRTHTPKKNCLVFTGVMNYAPNTDAAKYLIQNILPCIKNKVPDLQVLIVGREPTAALKELASKHPEVTITGFVDDVRDYLEQGSVFVAPLRYGSGVQNKVLEAMAMEVPVVATSIAVDGLRIDGVPEPPVYAADGDAHFAERVIALLQDAGERERLAREGRKYVEEHFIWSRSAEKLEQLCEAALVDWQERHSSG